MHCDEEYPLLTATRESPCKATKAQCSQKKKKKKAKLGEQVEVTCPKFKLLGQEELSSC